jgi:mono/diheme cytochrome c family protein
VTKKGSLSLNAALLPTAVLLAITLLSTENSAWSKVDVKKPKPAVNAEIGRSVFLTSCSGCHGADAKGGDGPNLHRQGLTESIIIATVSMGVPDEMPAFKKLTPSQISAVATYVLSLQ